MKSCISCLVTLAFMGVTAVLLWYFLGQPTADEAKQFIGDLDFGDFTDVLKNISDVNWGNLYKDEDPFVGDNTTNAWATQGTGLSLELQNALDDIWQQEFEEAVSDWEESEVLTLTTTRVAVDHSCGRVDGVMLVCNGNFGETGWVGINEVEIQYQRSGGPGFIISSVAKMNEYYLNNADYNKRLYTMCHEIGTYCVGLCCFLFGCFLVYSAVLFAVLFYQRLHHTMMYSNWSHTALLSSNNTLQVTDLVYHTRTKIPTMQI